MIIVVPGENADEPGHTRIGFGYHDEQGLRSGHGHFLLSQISQIQKNYTTYNGKTQEENLFFVF
jgi:hypothetical protein